MTFESELRKTIETADIIIEVRRQICLCNWNSRPTCYILGSRCSKSSGQSKSSNRRDGPAEGQAFGSSPEQNRFGAKRQREAVAGVSTETTSNDSLQSLDARTEESFGNCFTL